MILESSLNSHVYWDTLYKISMLNDVSQMQQMNVSCDKFYVNPIKAGWSESM